LVTIDRNPQGTPKPLRAYDALSQNNDFKKALLATGQEILTHSIGKSDSSDTILTEEEFCSRLMKLRNKIA
jgi:hypothetical protein